MVDIYNRLVSDQNYIPQIETNDETEQLLSQIKMVLGTEPGDVLGSPYFGADIKKYIFNLSYNQEEINAFVTQAILNSVDYDTKKFAVSVNVEFGKDFYNKSDYAVINIIINQRRCLGIVMNQ